MKVPVVSDDVIKLGVHEAREKLIYWRQLNVIQRARILERVVEKLMNLSDEIVTSVTLETGKSKASSEAEFRVGLEFMRSLAGAAKFASGIVIPSATPGKTAIYERTPFGLAILIASFNTPVPNYAWKIGPSFLSGNISILKPSEFTPLSSTLFVSAFEEDEEAIGTVLLLHGGAREGTKLLESNPDLVSFTGSYDTGLKIQKKLNSHVGKVILELGGNNAFVVFGDADLAAASEAAFQSACSNAGQRCAATRRIFVQEAIAQEFISLLTQRVQNSRVGIGEGFDFGPLISDEAFDKASKKVDYFKDLGFKIIQSPDRYKKERLFPASLVITETDRRALNDEEIFAPIFTCTIFKDENELIEIVNESRYSLTAALWTSDIKTAFRVSRSLRAGITNINGPTHGAEFQFPFGGIGKSGNGTKEVGIQCLDEYSFSRLITFVQE
jgi:acyl-CoA reductase-like NAD-dependent aldehyde dehydrogenase